MQVGVIAWNRLQELNRGVGKVACVDASLTLLRNPLTKAPIVVSQPDALHGGMTM